MFALPKDRCTIIANGCKYPAVHTWVELCDLRASKHPAIFINSDPTLGTNGPLQRVDITPAGTYFVNYTFFEETFTLPSDLKIDTIILPELCDLYVGPNEVYIETPDRVRLGVEHLMKHNPDMRFGLGVSNVRI